ncbi:MAG: alpha-glucosidase/alpha-galactosidase, partial [Candidatus Cloacimonetes bacterium]|nr:alpha-glucosidase/alpha-galactosidase [Candidatus Cloacimonadota bacterium]
MAEFNKKLKISMIGAGSLAFSGNLISDILLFTDLPKLKLKLSLMDIDKEKLKIVSAFAEKISNDKKIPVAIETTTDLDKTLDGADYVIAMFQTGGMEARKLDMEIPKKYGVNQSIADTLGPGGVFKAIRTVPVLIDICSKM